MKYICLVYHEEEKLHALSPSDMETLDADSIAYDGVMEASGHLIVAQALQSVKNAKSVKVRKGKVAITDGPFAETKEQLIGFILIEAKDFDEALDVATKIPLAKMGTVEVRPIYDFKG